MRWLAVMKKHGARLLLGALLTMLAALVKNCRPEPPLALPPAPGAAPPKDI